MLNNCYENAVVDFLSTDEYLQDPCDETAAKYISQYYKQRGKGDAVFRFAFSKDLHPFSKASHTMSAFLLGMYFKELVEEKVIRLMRRNTDYYNFDFEYPWFLCCLYHDAYSQYEKGHEDEITDSFVETKLNMEIDYDIYEARDMLEHRVLPLTYKKETIEKYYQQRYQIGKRRNGKGDADHGILSGYYFFDRLVKNYLRHKKVYGDGLDHFETPIKNEIRLTWDKKQLWVFGLAADAIIAHNIWHTSDYSNIDQLRPGGRKERKLSIEKTPLAYFLSLIDTIEPVKWFTSVPVNGEKHSEWDILRHIDMKIQDGIISITQDHDIFDFEKWYKGKYMDTIPSWLDGTMATHSNNYEEIYIHLPHTANHC